MKFSSPYALRKLPIGLTSAFVGAAAVVSVAAYLALRRPPPPPSPPPAVVVSSCREVAPGMRRFGFAIEFDEPEACATLRRHFRDMPPEVVYSVTEGSRRRDYMQIQASRLDFEEELKSTWAVFSDHIEKRNVQDRYGDVVGKDNWGYWKGGKDRRGNWVPGKRWRYIRFDPGTVVGYLPTTDENAQMFDVIISSACYPGTALP